MEIVKHQQSALTKTSQHLPIYEDASDVSVQHLDTYNDTGYEHLYRILWILCGVESVRTGVERFRAYSNLIVFVAPGIKLSIISETQPEGWVLQLSPSFFSRLKYENLMIGSADMLSTDGSTPKIILSPKVGERIHSLAGMIDELAGSTIENRENGIVSLVKTIFVYCESKCNLNLDKNRNHHEIDVVSRFKQLVVKNFTLKHKVSDYAKMMNITPKYLNQVVKQTMGITAKQVIQEQLVMKARQELKFSNQSIKEIAFSLGFSDPFHFSSFFKEIAGESPTLFRNR